MSLSPLWAAVLALASPIPVGADRKLRRRPWVTITLIAVNTVAYLLTRPDMSADSGYALFDRWGIVPAHPTLAAAVVSLFLHVSLLHLFWNMVFLWFFGAHVEEALGAAIYGAIYLCGGLMAGLLHVAICRLIAPAHPDVLQTPLVGASGAVSAVLAPYAVRYYRSRVRLVWVPGMILARRRLGHFEAPATAVIAVWLLENLVGAVRGALQPESGGVAYWAHVGGFVTGLVAAEMTGLLRKGWSDYVLDDARAAAQGHSGLERAVERYRAYLASKPGDWKVRLELAALLARDGDPAQQAEGRKEALEAVRSQIRTNRALECYEASLAVGIKPDLAPGDRFLLAGLAQDAGHFDRAIALLRSFLAAAQTGPDDEAARLRLAQLVQRSNPAEADSILQSFLAKYPRSSWRSVAEQRRRDIAQARTTG